MDNLFDSTNYPETEPTTLAVGARWAWKRPDITEAYPTASYTLKYRLILQTSDKLNIEITASKTGSEHVVEVSQASTALYSAGSYAWQAIIIRDSDAEELVVDRGYVELIADFGDQATDARSWVYRTLQNIRATIEGSATKEQASYSIGGRSLARRSYQELLELEKEFSARWKQEQDKLNREQGRNGSQKRIYIKMGA